MSIKGIYEILYYILKKEKISKYSKHTLCN